MCREGAAKMGIEHTDAVRLSWLRQPTTYRHRGGGSVAADDADVVACISTPGRVHHAFTATGMMNLAAMACIPGTIPNEIADAATGECCLRLGNPAGVVEVNAICSANEEGAWSAERVGFVRTARTLMSGDVHVPCNG